MLNNDHQDAPAQICPELSAGRTRDMWRLELALPFSTADLRAAHDGGVGSQLERLLLALLRAHWEAISGTGLPCTLELWAAYRTQFFQAHDVALRVTASRVSWGLVGYPLRAEDATRASAEPEFFDCSKHVASGLCCKWRKPSGRWADVNHSRVGQQVRDAIVALSQRMEALLAVKRAGLASYLPGGWIAQSDAVRAGGAADNLPALKRALDNTSALLRVANPTAVEDVVLPEVSAAGTILGVHRRLLRRAALSLDDVFSPQDLAYSVGCPEHQALWLCETMGLLGWVELDYSGASLESVTPCAGWRRLAV